MAIRNIDQWFEESFAIVNAIVAERLESTPDVVGFTMFDLDMSRSMVQVDDGIWFAAMVRQPGQKYTERSLWSMVSPDPSKVKALENAARQAELDRLAACYAADDGFEVECEAMTLATGLAHAYRHHTGDDPLFLLDMLAD